MIRDHVLLMLKHRRRKPDYSYEQKERLIKIVEESFLNMMDDVISEFEKKEFPYFLDMAYGDSDLA